MMPDAPRIIHALPAAREKYPQFRCIKFTRRRDHHQIRHRAEWQERLAAQRVTLHHRDLDGLRTRLTPEHVDERPAALIWADIHARQIVKSLGRTAVDREMLRAVEFDYIA